MLLTSTSAPHFHLLLTASPFLSHLPQPPDFEFDGPPIRTRYSEVFWTSQQTALPPAIVARFAGGRVMAITGYEVDILRTQPDGRNTSVTCYDHYNHHYSAFMHGADVRPLSDAELAAAPVAGRPPAAAHGRPLPVFVSAQACNFAGVWLNAAVDIAVNVTQAPGSDHFSAACIGDRGWKHANGTVSPPTATQPQGSATLDDGTSVALGVFSTAPAAGAPSCSLVSFSDHNVWCRQPYCGSAPPGPPPAVAFPSVQAFSEGNGNEYRRSFRGYSAGFAQLIQSPATWINMPMMINTRNPDPTSSALVGGPLPRNSLAPPNASYSGLLECPCTTRKPKVFDGYESRPVGSCPAAVGTAVECVAAAKAAGLLPVASTVNSTRADLPPGCSAVLGNAGWAVTFNADLQSVETCGGSHPTDPQHVAGRSDSMVAVAVYINAANDTVTVMLRGPAAVWFGVGLNASGMSDQPYAIIVAGGNGSVSERRLGIHAQGTLLIPSLRVVSNIVNGAMRTVVVQRPLVGATPSHYTFLCTPQRLPFIEAVGSTPALGYHKTRQSAILTVTTSAAPTCVCRDPTATGGTIDGVRFSRDCAPFPTSTVRRDNNSICTLRTYGGGLACCAHGSLLLDADQAIPGVADTFFFRYRFYFEDYSQAVAGAATEGVASAGIAPPTVRNAFRLWWGTEAHNTEYDVPKCTAGTLPADCVHVISSNFTGADLFGQCMSTGAACGDTKRVAADGGFQLVYAAAHCHAPACQSLELWNTDTGALICRNAAMYGNGTAAQDESSFAVGIPPCLWGSAAEGLPSPPILQLDTRLYSVKRVNNTNGHWGVMALWQMRGAYLNATV